MFELCFDHHTALIEGLNAVELALKQLCRHIINDLVDYPIWVAPEYQKRGVAKHEQVMFALQKLDIIKGAPGATLALPSVVACNQKSIELIDAVNDKKRAFKSVLTETKKLMGQKDKTAYIRKVFSKAGYFGIALKHVCREIHYLHEHPDKLTWLHTRNSSLKYISNAEAHSALIKAEEGDTLDIQLAKLNIISENQKLGIYRPIRHVHQVNYVIGEHRAKVSTSLPLFFLLDGQAPLPGVSFRAPSTGRATRSDKKVIGDKPYLPSIGAWLFDIS